MYLAAALVVGVPALRIALGVWRLQSTTYVLTDRRGAAIRVGLMGSSVLWTSALIRGGKLVPRAVRLSGAGPRGHIVFSAGRKRREMSMVLDPERALADVRAALEL